MSSELLLLVLINGSFIFIRIHLYHIEKIQKKYNTTNYFRKLLIFNEFELLFFP